jgi:uncharacterized protein
MDFEWDEAKRQDNVRKHGVDFDEAMVIFEGNIIDWIDDREDYGEERLVALGRAGLLVLRVVFTLRGKTIRLISAQKASKNDQKRYYRSFDAR